MSVTFIKDAKVLTFDVETTGLDVNVARVVEFGGVLYAGGEMTRRRTIINPGVPIPFEASRVHGITDDVVVGKKTFAEAWPRIEPWFDDVLACGYNATRYDAPLLNAELERHGFSFRFDVDAILDVMVFVNYALRGERHRNLGATCLRYGIKPEGGKAHSAAVDCQMTTRLLLAMVDAGVIPDTVEAAMTAQRHMSKIVEADYERYGVWVYTDRETGVLRIGAGQHCGKPLTDVSKEYFAWLLRRMHDLPSDTKRLFAAGAQGRVADEQMSPSMVEVGESRSVISEDEMGDVRR